MKNVTFTFITNLVHHHQIPLADEMYKILGDNYKYIATEPLPDWLRKGGYDASINRPYIVRTYESEEASRYAMDLANDSDVVIAGAVSHDFMKQRVKENKLTFFYSERFFKDGYYHLLSPRAWYYLYNKYIKNRNKKFYILCASAFAAGDVAKFFSFPNKRYKWGYITQVNACDINQVVEHKEYASILWTARMLKWKHPEVPIACAVQLRDKGYKFKLRMIGVGELEEKIRSLINCYNLNDCVELLGSMPNAQVLSWMQRSQIFIFTSDKNEGWGAVLNEAMSNGCAVVASSAIGAVPFLINNGINGFIYKDGDVSDLTDKVEKILSDHQLCRDISVNAYKTMSDVWSPTVAARRLVELSESLLCDEKPKIFKNGPCSAAPLLSNHWFKEG